MSVNSLILSVDGYFYYLFDFINSLTFLEFLIYFWPFFLLDLTRYLLLDALVIFLYIPRKILMRGKMYKARITLYKEMPLVTFLVPGKNEGKHIPRLAESLQQQTYKNFELIVVDDGSDDNTHIICRQLEREKKIDKFIRQSMRGGKAAAANTALCYAKGKYIVHIDADSHLSDDALETILLPFYLDEKIGAVGGDVRVANTFASMATRMQAIEYSKSISVGRTVTSMLGILRIISGAHGAFRRDILQRIHGWDVGPGLDGDITLKIRKLGYKVVHEPDAICYTNTPEKFSQLAKQRFRWDRSLVRFRLRKHSDLLQPSKSFRLSNFITSLDNIFYNFILNFKWWIYFLLLLIFGADDSLDLLLIFSINYFFYFLSNLLEYTIACLLYGKSLRRENYFLFFYILFVPFYTGIFLRTVRTYAYTMELLFKASYYDKWNPWKVSKVAHRENL
ncbi:MAG: glycosyltransferase family 2 protein [Betaproteobacteria bacterium]|nr:glycosyltransferase family 2 protein [Betaproteobacteria bacterium]